MFNENRTPDFLTGLVIPVVGAVVAVVSLQRDHPYVAGLSLCVIALGVLSRYGAAVSKRLRRMVWTRHDRQVLNGASVELGHFVFEFERFMLWDDGMPNPYAIVSSAVRRGRTKEPFDYRMMVIENPDTLKRFWNVLTERCRQRHKCEEDIRHDFREFHEIIDRFDQGQLLSIFGNDADKLRQALNEQARSELNAAREQYSDFLRRYVTFLRETNTKLTDKILPLRADPPKPL